MLQAMVEHDHIEDARSILKLSLEDFYSTGCLKVLLDEGINAQKVVVSAGGQDVQERSASATYIENTGCFLDPQFPKQEETQARALIPAKYRANDAPFAQGMHVALADESPDDALANTNATIRACWRKGIIVGRVVARQIRWNSCYLSGAAIGARYIPELVTHAEHHLACDERLTEGCRAAYATTGIHRIIPGRTVSQL